MKKIDWKLGVIGVLIGLSAWLTLNPQIQEVEKITEVKVLQTLIDTFYVDKIVEKKIFKCFSNNALYPSILFVDLHNNAQRCNNFCTLASWI